MNDIIPILLLMSEIGAAVWLLNTLLPLADVLPTSGKCSISYFNIDRTQLIETSPEAVLQHIRTQSIQQQQQVLNASTEERLRLISVSGVTHEARSSLFLTINTYLIRTHFVQPDVQLIIGLVDRYLSNATHLMRFLIFVPFCLGLLAFAATGSGERSFGPWVLLIGFILTAALLVMYVTRQTNLAKRSQQFHHFLLGQLQVAQGSSFTDSIQQLRSELHSFSTNLQKQIDQLAGAHDGQLAKLDTVQQHQLEAIKSQTALLTEIRKMDFPQITRFNTDVLLKMKETTESFGMFTQLANSLGGLLQSMDNVATGLNKGLERTEQIGSIAAEVRETVQ
ncbi:MAG: hypothetical protein ACRC3B_09260, partial [Bacteroidia bacterium]